MQSAFGFGLIGQTPPSYSHLPANLYGTTKQSTRRTRARMNLAVHGLEAESDTGGSVINLKLQ
jgi:hypothetical protein